MSQNILPLTISASGVSAGFYLPPGDNWLFLRAGSWGSATLQVSPDDSAGSFVDARDSAGNVVTITSNWQNPVAGGAVYRLNVTAYTAPITVASRRATANTF
jgi:hypothetical protein